MSSKVVGIVKTSSSSISLEFKWEINNFCISCAKVGEYLESPKFTACSVNGNILWYLRLYPKGIRTDVGNHLSLYLYGNGDIKTSVNITFKLLNNDDIVVVSKNTVAAGHVFNKNAGWGYEKFLSPDLIPNLALNGGDKITTIVCKINMSAHEEGEKKLNEEVEDEDYLPKFKVLDIYEDLINDIEFSNVSLISEGKTLKVNKCILAKNSPVFAAMFDVEMKEKQENTVEIDDIKYDVLVEIIRFVYVRRIENLDAIAGELAVAADKYELEELKGTCEKTMTKNLNLDNVVDCLQYADKLRMDKLKEKAIEFIVEKGRSDITDKPEFQLLSHDIVCKVCCALAKKIK